MNIRMAYPDRSMHDISPIRLVYVGGNVYVLNYFDNNENVSMATVLLRENGRFFKQPLREYGSDWHRFYEYSQRRGIEVSLDRLSSLIFCKLPEYISEVESMVYSHEPIKKDPPRVAVAARPQYIIYHNLSDGEYYWDEECTMIVKGGLESLKEYDYIIKDVKGLKKISNYRNIYRDEIIPSSDNTIHLDDIDDKGFYQEYLYDRNKSTFYLKEEVAKRFNLKGNKFKIKYNFYDEGTIKSKEEDLVIIPIFDIVDEKVKRELHSHRIEIENSQIVEKNEPRSIRLYIDNDGNRFLLGSKFLDKYVQNYDMDISYQDEYENLYKNRRAIRYTPELRMNLERIAREHIYFYEEKILIKEQKQRNIDIENLLTMLDEGIENNPHDDYESGKGYGM